MIEILKLRKKRYEFFKDADHYLKRIWGIAKRHLQDPEVYLFGSFAENMHVPSSDIDVLIVSKRVTPDDRVKVITDVYKEFGYEHPFEIHITDHDGLSWYRKFAKKMVKVEGVRRKASE